MEIPMGVRAGDFNSVKQKGLLINMIADLNKEGDYIAVRRLPGLASYDSSLTEPIRSNFYENGGYFYFVSDTLLYRFVAGGAPVSLGTVGGMGRALITGNSVPGNNQILILNGSGQGYIYNNSGLNQIVDVDFASTTSAAILNERFWFVETDTNTLFASDVSDGAAYNALSFLNAEWKPDPLVIVASVGSAIWGLGTETMEYFQSVDDNLVPLRPVRGYSREIGIQAETSFAQLDDYFAFLGNDSSIYLTRGTEVVKISDIDFEKKIFGDGTSVNPGFTTEEIQECEGFWVQTPEHNIYYLTFPSKDYTWGFDVTTGIAHNRQSRQSGTDIAWRALRSIQKGNVVYLGDRLNGNLWTLSPDSKAEGTDTLIATMRCPSVSFGFDVIIPGMALECEVAVAESVSDEPWMMVRYSIDGGKTWINHEGASLGNWGEHDTRIVLDHFGYVPRHKDFIVEFKVSDGVRFQMYKVDAFVERCS